MAKSRRVKKPRRSTTVPVAKQPAMLWPVVTRVSPHEAEWSLSDDNMDRLEEAACVQFTPEARRAIKAIAEGWVDHDRTLHRPRPGAFKKRFQMMAKVEPTSAELDLNREDAPSLDRHLFIWLLNADFEAARDLLRTSGAMAAQELVKSVQVVQNHLPPDPGRTRPMDEDRFIVYLADQFETTGIQATAYANQYTDSHYGETQFRTFVHQLYAMLPLKKRRTQSGLDEAMIRALKDRRGHSEKG